jgi:hypothetical protein
MRSRRHRREARFQPLARRGGLAAARPVAPQGLTANFKHSWMHGSAVICPEGRPGWPKQKLSPARSYLAWGGRTFDRTLGRARHPRHLHPDRRRGAPRPAARLWRPQELAIWGPSDANRQTLRDRTPGGARHRHGRGARSTSLALNRSATPLGAGPSNRCPSGDRRRRSMVRIRTWVEHDSLLQ